MSAVDAPMYSFPGHDIITIEPAPSYSAAVSRYAFPSMSIHLFGVLTPIFT